MMFPQDRSELPAVDNRSPEVQGGSRVIIPSKYVVHANRNPAEKVGLDL